MLSTYLGLERAGLEPKFILIPESCDIFEWRYRMYGTHTVPPVPSLHWYFGALVPCVLTHGVQCSVLFTPGLHGKQKLVSCTVQFTGTLCS